MSPQRYQRVREVFLAVCERPADEQAAAVDDLCADDADLKSEVQSLLEMSRKVEVSNPTIAIAGVEKSRVHTVDTLSAAPAASRDGGHSRSSRSHSTNPRATRFAVQGRFPSGTVLAERYRIVSLLGAGGMGEVYRADDLTLDQPVALKFLPASVNSDPAWLEKFHTEVRLSRQVTHPNVCRVFDIGVVDGEQFISMEFVDGEDLASLLRRIGRLPRDKALQIARQLCAGLAAAHDKGVLHRDLKPANVMVDGRGQVRITDFGISTFEGSQDGSAGTPAYMAPEQFEQGQASVRSDIYSLGLVLYEVFSGKPAFSANSMLEYAKMHRQTSPTHPSTHIPDMDPLAERVILRCLEKDPARRPPSVLGVSAALPGGDPLAAALAAGETPSPEMVAAAGGTAGVGVAYAAMMLVFTLAALVISVLLAGGANLSSHMALDKPPAVLADKARQVLSAAGWTQNFPSSAQGFAIDDQYVALIKREETTRSAWDRLASARPGAAYFWYRESPDYMVSRDDIGMVNLDEPARSLPGMRTVVLGLQGRLKRLEVLPEVGEVWDSPASAAPTTQSAAPQTAAQQIAPASSAPASDFAALFSQADLRPADFTPIAPQFTPPMFADKRLAWQGKYPENPSEIVQVHAAFAGGRPVFFDIVESWRDRAKQLHIVGTPDLRTGNIALQSILILVSLGSGIALAWQNLRAGRGDASGAHKLAGVFLIMGLLLWLLCSSHTPLLNVEMRMFFRALGFILVPAAIVWMFYLGLEPYVRRIWPETVISWNRLLAGRLTDPLVAAHILTGIAIGALAAILTQLGNLIPLWMDRAPATPNLNILMRFLARENPLAVTLWTTLEATYIGILYLLSLVLFQVVLKRRWLASTAFVLLATVAAVPWGDAGWVQWILCAAQAGLILFLLVRFGLVATLAALLVIYLTRFVPMTSNMNLWYATQTRFAIGLLGLMAIAAATLATGGWRGKSGRAVQLALDSRF